MTVDEALAFYATTETVDLVWGLHAGHVLAAEVERLRGEVSTRNQRALDGDEAVAAMNAVHEARERAEVALAALREQRCEWAEDADGNWDTSCDNKYCFFTGGPAENGMVFCCYCGSRLVQFLARREP